MRRADVNYNLLTGEVDRRLAHPRYPLSPISEFETALQYGCSKRATEEEVGVPILRMNNLQANGWDLTDLKYVELTPEELERWRLDRGDIVFNRTNSKELVGKCEVFDRPGVWVFASYLMRLKVNRDKVRPEFVRDFLNTKAGRAQIDRESRQIIGMSNINAEEIRMLRIPLPAPALQDDLVQQLDTARRLYIRKLQEADELLSSLDGFVLKQLGIALPPHSERTTYAVRREEILNSGKLFPDYFHPDRIGAIKAIRAQFKGDRATTLGEIAEFIREQRTVKPTDEYLGLANVQPHTGERVQSTDEDGEGNCFEYQPDDVLFARLRPYLNKVLRAETGGVCSTEFHVIRIQNQKAGKNGLRPDYLAAILRSSLTLWQTRHMMTGNTHPRLANEDIVNLVVPVPPPAVQERIVDAVAHRRIEARQLRKEAGQLWEEAKAEFEVALLGSTNPTRSKGGG